MNSLCSVAMVPAWPLAVMMISVWSRFLEFGGERIGAAREDADIGADGDEQRAALEPVARVGLVGREDAGRQPALRMRRMASSISGFTLGLAISPAWPIEACRSAGPMNTPSTPSIPQIASMLSSAAAVSTCTSTQISSCARFA